nr:hypothetical protein WMHIBSEC_WMHIBSEC_CDS_0023 [Caudoviricetes sp.]CAI9751703.1 hypothetical protein AZFZUZMX_AZFZUZMX_CDS_0023 [Caudoviricetes sp.]
MMSSLKSFDEAKLLGSFPNKVLLSRICIPMESFVHSDQGYSTSISKHFFCALSNFYWFSFGCCHNNLYICELN